MSQRLYNNWTAKGVAEMVARSFDVSPFAINDQNLAQVKSFNIGCKI